MSKVTLKLDKDQKDPEQKLDFVFVSKHEAAWAPDKWAVLGFSPKSQFVQYLRNNTEKVTISFDSKLKKMTGFEYEMDTKLTFNRDFTNSNK